jgi:hypothetical protein
MRVWLRLVSLAVLAAVLATLSGCAVPAKMALFEDSNQVFLESTVREVDIAGPISEVVPDGSTVCVVSIETAATTDIPVLAMIEDEFVKVLVSAGYTVVERDDDLLKRMASEHVGDGYTLLGFPQPEIRTGLLPAEYIASYRVLESGLIYRKGSKHDKVAREAMVRLHLRVQNSGSSEILLARTIEGDLEDEIDRSLAGELADFHYTHYSSQYPVQRGPDVTPRQLESKQSKPAPGAGGALAALMAGIAVLVLLSAAK